VYSRESRQRGGDDGGDHSVDDGEGDGGAGEGGDNGGDHSIDDGGGDGGAGAAKGEK